MSMTLYTLSTCVHCRQVKEFLEQNNVTFSQILVDKLEQTERKTALEELKKHNPRVSFPTLVINDGELVVIGNNQEELKAALGL